MKSLIINILFLLFACIGSSCFSQMRMRLNVKFDDSIEIKKYQEQDLGFEVKSLHMSPGSHKIKNSRASELLKHETIVAVDLVYTDFPVGEDFSELNRRRVIELFGALPQAFNREMVSWRIVKQTGVSKTGGINNYFHGFKIYYRQMPSNSAENKLIQDIISGKVKPEDSTLLKVFERNENWKDMLVVCDVTGSMSPYTAQLLLWIKANQKLRSMKNIVFFNDDDEKSHNHKGKHDNHGMWSVSSRNYEKVLETAIRAMNEGQHIENNLEAICRAIQEFPEGKKRVLMIADNWEDPCDMHLLSFLKKNQIPVRIIVCGVNSSFNMKYLEIARATGGTVHTMEDDLTNLALLKEGAKFKIGDIKIQLRGGRFHQLN